MTVFCSLCGDECTEEDQYSDCCGELVTADPHWLDDTDGWDRNGVVDASGHVHSDADPGL